MVKTLVVATLVAAAAEAGKVGIAADWSTPAQGAAVARFVNAQTVGHYNWSPWRFDNLPGSVDFWAMLHGEESIGDWGHVNRNYASTAMGCNEVDQMNMSVERGVQIWRERLLPLASQGMRLVSHSTTQDPRGLAWQNAWRAQCPECHNSVWAYAVHWYGTDPEAFKAYITQFHNAVGKPIIVTEFACTDFSNAQQCDAGRARAFMDATTQWLNGQNFVLGYFWFGMWPANAMPGGVQPGNSLLNPDGTPSALGLHYIGVAFLPSFTSNVWRAVVSYARFLFKQGAWY